MDLIYDTRNILQLNPAFVILRMLSEYSFSSRLVVLWGALFLYIFVAESELSAKEFEREALLNTSWWNNGVINNTSDHCKWVGIVCNSAGTVVEINLFNRKIKGELRKLNFSCFRNLESLSLGSNSLSANIPSEISTLSKLRYLNLDQNNLAGELLVLLAIVIIIFFDRDGQISLGKGFRFFRLVFFFGYKNVSSFSLFGILFLFLKL
ncbi:hypothetical protein EZV62_007053 [Acer yangbiense]|uniref:Leucine-rich repeat-containing N-terminal plant-type domain-containing protein n=1 Tax=Acer yangbiense TaxID=1000413 RepID=A0A5C7I9H5_9ROSI|nr:hypothetical protein EZV62_007053 [Acer yangbiense]